MTDWKRYRFKSAAEDPRPLVFPPPGPYWISGYEAMREPERAVLIAYLPAEAVLTEYWPEAEAVEAEPSTGPKFSGRFPRPPWWKEPAL